MATQSYIRGILKTPGCNFIEECSCRHIHYIEERIELRIKTDLNKMSAIEMDQCNHKRTETEESVIEKITLVSN